MSLSYSGEPFKREVWERLSIDNGSSHIARNAGELQELRASPG